MSTTKTVSVSVLSTTVRGSFKLEVPVRMSRKAVVIKVSEMLGLKVGRTIDRSNYARTMSTCGSLDAGWFNVEVS